MSIWQSQDRFGDGHFLSSRAISLLNHVSGLCENHISSQTKRFCVGIPADCLHQEKCSWTSSSMERLSEAKTGKGAKHSPRFHSCGWKSISAAAAKPPSHTHSIVLQNICLCARGAFLSWSFVTSIYAGGGRGGSACTVQAGGAHERTLFSLCTHADRYFLMALAVHAPLSQAAHTTWKAHEKKRTRAFLFFFSTVCVLLCN